MYRFYINNVDNDYHYGELARVFLSDNDFEIITVKFDSFDNLLLSNNSFIVNKFNSDDRDTIKAELYNLLFDITGIKSEWGILTGVRPLKLALQIYSEQGSVQKMKEVLHDRYLVSESKIQLLTEIVDYQVKHISGIPYEKQSLYVGIPFCPTRCAYCSFASNVASDKEIQEYFDNLLKEIEYMGKLTITNGIPLESIYIGGGTPTTLNANQIKRLIENISNSFKINPSEIEFTIEAGRPDTITSEKLAAMRDLGISRISINPQTMKDETLKLIGRNHTTDDIVRAYNLSKEYDFDVINADLIAGLQDEDFDDFKTSINEVINLGANNITVHTLSVKRGSRLKENDPEYFRQNAQNVAKMLDFAHKVLAENGFYPYYIYRQKHQIGFFENVGYCKENKHSIYNVRIMEDKQTIIGLGAGAIGKVYYPEEDRLERIANVSNYRIYSDRFDEMIERKNKYFGG